MRSINSEVVRRIDLSIIIPCYRSELFLYSNVEEIIAEIQKMINSKINTFEILLIVDGSPDNTITVARLLEEKHKQVRVIELNRNFGQHAAIFAGIYDAKMPWILTMDDDGQHPASEISTMLAEISPGVDVIYGSPRLEEHGLIRSFMSRQAKYITYKALRIENARQISAFRLFRRTLLGSVDLIHLTNGVVDVVLHWSTTRFSSVEVDMQKRKGGKSNYSISGLFKFAAQMITGYSTRPLKLATLIGFSSFIVSILAAVVVLIERILGKIKVPGYTTLVLLVLILGSIQLFALGIIGEYLGRIHEKTMGKPLFVIRHNLD